jgi:hypothetical protein
MGDLTSRSRDVTEYALAVYRELKPLTAVERAKKILNRIKTNSIISIPNLNNYLYANWRLLAEESGQIETLGENNLIRPQDTDKRITDLEQQLKTVLELNQKLLANRASPASTPVADVGKKPIPEPELESEEDPVTKALNASMGGGDGTG